MLLKVQSKRLESEHICKKEIYNFKKNFDRWSWNTLKDGFLSNHEQINARGSYNLVVDCSTLSR